jgi:hypothetical protein
VCTRVSIIKVSSSFSFSLEHTHIALFCVVLYLNNVHIHRDSFLIHSKLVTEFFIFYSLFSVNISLVNGRNILKRSFNNLLKMDSSASINLWKINSILKFLSNRFITNRRSNNKKTYNLSRCWRYYNNKWRRTTSLYISW